jgi:hypothetical protein
MLGITTTRNKSTKMLRVAIRADIGGATALKVDLISIHLAAS